MSMLSKSSLPLWLKVLCFLSLVRPSMGSPVNVIDDKSLVDRADKSPMYIAGITPFLNESAIDVEAPVPNCATLPGYAEWFQPSEKFDNGDCLKAMELFYNDYTRDHEGIKYEFLASGVTPVHGIPTQRVPLKVGYGSCYVVIAMRNMFSEGELPGETPTTSAGSDVCSFTQLYQYAQNVYEKCSRPEVNHPGWYPAGDLNSIAVFLWQAASDINKRIHLPHHTGLDSPDHTGLNLISTSGSTPVSGSLHLHDTT